MQETYSKMEWVLFAFVLPLLFTVVLAGVVLQFLGVNVIQSVSAAVTNASIVRHFFPSAGPVDTQKQKLQSEVASLERDLESLTRTNGNLQKKLQSETSQLNTAQAAADQLRKQLTAVTAANASYADQAQVYSQMSPDKAAQVISALPASVASQVLAKIKVDDRASILESMDPKIAAALMNQTLASAGTTNP